MGATATVRRSGRGSQPWRAQRCVGGSGPMAPHTGLPLHGRRSPTPAALKAAARASRQQPRAPHQLAPLPARQLHAAIARGDGLGATRRRPARDRGREWHRQPRCRRRRRGEGLRPTPSLSRPCSRGRLGPRRLTTRPAQRAAACHFPRNTPPPAITEPHGARQGFGSRRGRPGRRKTGGQRRRRPRAARVRSDRLSPTLYRDARRDASLP